MDYMQRPTASVPAVLCPNFIFHLHFAQIFVTFFIILSKKLLVKHYQFFR